MSSVLLLSGGIDSATILTSITKENEKVFALTFDYGQKHYAEIEKAKNLAKEFNVYEHKIIKLNLSEFTDSSLTDKNIQVPKSLPDDNIPNLPMFLEEILYFYLLHCLMLSRKGVPQYI